MENYKQYHEEYVISDNGTTSLETFSLIFPSVLQIFIATTVSSFILNNELSNAKSTSKHFIIDFLIIVIPLILYITVLNNNVFNFILLLLIVSSSIFVLFYIEKQQHIYRKQTESKRYFITNARSTILLISIVAILAVDFKIFPRRFAKTKSFGYSLMDVGVGLFVFSNGIVAPEINKPRNFIKSAISTIPLWILGCARFFLTKGTNYHVNVLEYGIHWNFFMTLAVSKILASFILIFINIKHSLIISIIVLTIHETLLKFGLSSWVLSDLPRNNFISANREGIVSSLGYVGLYFLSVHIGKLFKTYKNDLKLSILLFSTSILLLSSVKLLEKYLGISRRLANAGYCLWTLFLGTFMCFLFLCFEHLNKYLYNNSNQIRRIFVPVIYEAVSYNGLACFLLANILTGLINLSFPTFIIGPLNSLIIIILYMFIVCVVMTVLYINNIKLKLW